MKSLRVSLVSLSLLSVAASACGMLPTMPAAPPANSLAAMPSAPTPNSPSALRAASTPSHVAPVAEPSSSSPSSTLAKSTPAAADPGLPAEVDITPPAREPDLRASIGPRGDSAAPIVFDKLTRSMTPADVAKLFPGADKPSKFGIVDVKPPSDVPGVAGYTFSYQDGKLYKASIKYKTALTNKDFYGYFVKVTTNKYGPAKDDDIAKQILTWAQSDGSMVQADKMVDHYEVSYVPPR